MITPLLLSFLLLTAADGGELIGTAAPPWQVEGWMNSEPLELDGLRGRVVLVRWWTAPGCPFCRASAPALGELHERYQEQGLTVIGFYHHKASTPLRTAAVAKAAEGFGFEFPLAIDPEWRTLRRWWLDGGERSYTSVTFVLDRGGVIRHIHPGGQYVAGDPDHRALVAAVERLLAEDAPR